MHFFRIRTRIFKIGKNLIIKNFIHLKPRLQFRIRTTASINPENVSVYLCWYHEEAEEPVGEKHLDLLVVGGQVALRIVRLVRVGPAPLETCNIQSL